MTDHERWATARAEQEAAAARQNSAAALDLLERLDRRLASLETAVTLLAAAQLVTQRAQLAHDDDLMPPT